MTIMEINTPLHGYVHLGVIGKLVSIGYLAVILNKFWVKKHNENRIITSLVLGSIFLAYTAAYSYICFFYRSPMEEAHIRLEPFWSYREAFSIGGIERLGVARSIILNILITVPLGYFLPAAFRFSSHPYRNTILFIFLLSVSTEFIQYATKTGLCETDDVINNLLGGIIGLTGYILADQLAKKVLD